MEQVPDDPIVRSIERTGYPPLWYRISDKERDIPDYFDDEFEDGDGDVYYGNSTDEF